MCVFVYGTVLCILVFLCVRGLLFAIHGATMEPKQYQQEPKTNLLNEINRK